MTVTSHRKGSSDSWTSGSEPKYSYADGIRGGDRRGWPADCFLVERLHAGAGRHYFDRHARWRRVRAQAPALAKARRRDGSAGGRAWRVGETGGGGRVGTGPPRSDLTGKRKRFSDNNRFTIRTPFRSDRVCGAAPVRDG